MLSVSQTLWFAQSMLEKLPEMQIQPSIRQPPLGTGDPAQPLVALCSLETCALSLFLPLETFASTVREGGLHNITNVPKLEPREVVALLGFNPSNKQNHSNFHKEGDQNCSAGN